MNKLVKQFQKAFAMMERKREIGWDKIYIGVDIHETVVKPTWTANIDKEFYEYAKETLQLLSNDKEICLILWSCSRPELNKQYSEFFQENGITFDYINENPEVKSTVYADFDTKLYFNVGLDDKFGWDESDWYYLYKYFKKRNNTFCFYDNVIFYFKIFKNKNEKISKLLDKGKMFRRNEKI